MKMRNVYARLGIAQHMLVLLLTALAVLLPFLGFTFVGVVVWMIGYSWSVLIAALARPTRAQSVQLAAQILLTVGVAAPAIRFEPHGAVFSIIAVLLLLLLVPPVHALKTRQVTYLGQSAGLADAEFLAKKHILKNAAVVACAIAPAVLLALSVARVPGSVGLLLAFVSASLLVAAWIQQKFAVRQDRRQFDALPALVEQHKPQFMVHWDAPGESKYQLDMWLPHLNDLNLPFVVVVREPGAFTSAVAAADSQPVVVAAGHTDVERLLVPSVSAVFYVNNADRNNQVLRFEGVTHIMLSHGDSQKTTSSTRIFRLFDRICMAGPAGIDRFSASGVEIPAERFAIVGRPQVRGIEQDSTPIRDKPTPTVLYAPTWMGDFQDSSYTSLLYARSLIELLIERGCTVIFRPHPFTNRHRETAEAANSLQELLRLDRERRQTPHVFGRTAESELTLHECFNRSDAMIADISAVVSDYLYSGKPVGVFAEDESLRQCTEAEGRYQFGRDSTMWAEQLDRMLIDDPLSKQRHEARRYYLGNADIEPADRLFLEIARNDVRPMPYTPHHSSL